MDETQNHYNNTSRNYINIINLEETRLVQDVRLCFFILRIFFSFQAFCFALTISYFFSQRFPISINKNYEFNFKYENLYTFVRTLILVTTEANCYGNEINIINCKILKTYDNNCACRKNIFKKIFPFFIGRSNGY